MMMGDEMKMKMHVLCIRWTGWGTPNRVAESGLCVVYSVCTRRGARGGGLCTLSSRPLSPLWPGRPRLSMCIPTATQIFCKLKRHSPDAPEKFNKIAITDTNGTREARNSTTDKNQRAVCPSARPRRVPTAMMRPCPQAVGSSRPQFQALPHGYRLCCGISHVAAPRRRNPGAFASVHRHCVRTRLGLALHPKKDYGSRVQIGVAARLSPCNSERTSIEWRLWRGGYSNWG